MKAIPLKTRPQPDLRENEHHLRGPPRSSLARQIIFTSVETLQLRLRQLTGGAPRSMNFCRATSWPTMTVASPRDVLQEGGGSRPRKNYGKPFTNGSMDRSKYLSRLSDLCRNDESTRPNPVAAYTTGSSSGNELVGDSFGLVSLSLSLSFLWFFFCRGSKWYMERFSV